MSTLNTRPPTCVVPWPLILVEGGEKAGKSWLFAELSASECVGRCLWLDLGEGSADEYGDAITGQITYEVIVHDGSWAAILDQVQAAHDEAARAREAGEKPVCLGIDSGTFIWEMLKDWGAIRARSSNKNKRILAQDPNAEIIIPPNVWNDIHKRHNRLMRLLMTFPGICVVTARGKETIKIGPGGEPIEGAKAYKVESQKDLPFNATAWIRLSRDAHPMIMAVRSKFLKIRHGRDDAQVVPNLTLEDFIFNGLRCSTESQPRDLVELGRERTPEQVRDDALATTDRERLLELLTEAAHPAFVGMTVENENGNEEVLADLIVRRGLEVTGQPAESAKPQPKPNRFAKLNADRAAQNVPAAPASAGTSPDELADAKLLDRLGQALAACGSMGVAAQLAVCSALLGLPLRRPEDLTRAQANRVGQAAQAALATAQQQQTNPNEVLAAMVAQAMTNRQAATAAAKPGKAA